MERLRANLIYASIFIVISYVVLANKFDKAVATGNYYEGVITRIETVHMSSSSKYRGVQVLRKFDLYISLENGKKIVKRVHSRTGKERGLKMKVHEYKSKIRGVTKYEIMY